MGSHSAVNFFYLKQMVTVKIIIILNHLNSSYLVCEVRMAGVMLHKGYDRVPVSCTYILHN